MKKENEMISKKVTNYQMIMLIMI